MNYKLLAFMVICFFPLTVYSKNSQEYIEVNCIGKKNIECKLTAYVDYEVSAIDFHFSLPKGAKVTSYELDSHFQGSAEDNWVSLYSDENTSGEIPIGSFKIEADKRVRDKDFLIKDLLIYDAKYEEHKVIQSEKKSYNLLLIGVICGIIILGIIVAYAIKLKGKLK